MKRSTDRILTTHTGSLPRPWDLTTTLEALDAGTAPDPEAFDARVRGAVAEVVKKQVAAGVDVVNDGEQGKVGYSTYVRHRLTGFGGSSAVPARADWADFPEATARQGRSTVARPSCTGPVDWRDKAAGQKDIANLQAALVGVPATEAFMTAASPGVIAHFLRNEYYPGREAYLARLTDVMKEEYDAIAKAGFVLQVDCPDLAMGRHLAFPDLSTAEFLKIAAANVEALNHALRDIPPERLRLHLCWGNYEGPHHRDIPPGDILGVAQGASPRDLARGRNPPPRARVGGVQGDEAPRRQGAHSGRPRLDDQLHRAPGAGGAADRALRGGGGPGAGDRRQRLRLRNLRSVNPPGRARDRLGQAREAEGQLASQELWR
jgi:5-methyltetrahydropteroyltriglutamate--homocysteine methyltransferase